MIVLGINAYHGDVAAALIRDGALIVAVEEERFTRIKHSAGFPANAVRACLNEADIDGSAVDVIAVSRKPMAHLWRKAAFVLRTSAYRLVKGRAGNHQRVRDVASPLAQALGVSADRVRQRLRFVEHHPAHLASAFFVSPFSEAAVCAIDGFGDFVSTSWGLGRESRLHVADRVFFPHSLGLLYLAVTQYLGFPRYGDEFKVMGLAPYGEPRFVTPLRELVHLTDRGRFKLDLSYFRHASDGVDMSWEAGEPTLGPVFTPKLERLLGPARRPDDPIEARHEAIAASLQVVHEESVFHVLRHVRRASRQRRLCLAGGCAMNSVANGKVREHTGFDELFIQPAAGDNGTALGAALAAVYDDAPATARVEMRHAYWGPMCDEGDIAAAIHARHADLDGQRCRSVGIDDPDERCRSTAAHIAAGHVVGWYQGRMEWGARALGNRSILADPRRADMREIINAKIKFREKFRPFAPSILEEFLDEYFEDAVRDPFMIQVYPVRREKRDVIPAVTHVDGSGRLQTVSRDTNELYWRLIAAFHEMTGVPVVLNTSFNENEPIVLRPAEALDCFLRTQMDVLVMGTRVLEKAGAQLEAVA
jgi:carbamoyltransferase